MPDNLPELRDIHLPDGVSYFPFAYGWWLIAVAIIGSFALYQLVRFLLQKSKKRYALRLLNDIYCSNSLKAAASMSEILRRVCISKYPFAASFSGNEWINFLNSHSQSKLSAKTAELLLNAPYMPENSSHFQTSDVTSLRIFCQKWIGENL